MAQKNQVTVDVEQFVRTRDALTTAFVGLSSALDKAVKAYIEHTNSVLAGESALNIGYLSQPIHDVAQLTQHALGLPAGATATTPVPASTTAPVVTADAALDDGKKKRKRPYKPRDPNAPKRPLTAYLRYLQEQRPIIAQQLADDPTRTDTRPGDVSKVATDRWHALNAAQQAVYRNGYKQEMVTYDQLVKAYKAAGGEIDDEAELDGDGVPSKLETAVADDEDEGDTEDVAPPPPPAPKPASPEAAKKTPKSKKAPAAAAAAAPSASAPTPKFSSVNPPAPAGAAPAASTPTATTTSAKKRKAPASATPAGAEDDAAGPAVKKRGRKTKAEKEASDAAAAAAQLAQEESGPAAPAEEKKAKKEKKKRKSEAAAAA